jgi:hypothetical protein
MKILKVVLTIIGLQVTCAAHADCYSIKDNDNKNLCLAKTKNQSGYCYSINDHDSKNSCLAQVKQQRNYCYNIRNSDLKNECLALVK